MMYRVVSTPVVVWCQGQQGTQASDKTIDAGRAEQRSMPAIMLKRERPDRQAACYREEQQDAINMVRHACKERCVAGKQPADRGDDLKNAGWRMGRLERLDGANVGGTVVDRIDIG